MTHKIRTESETKEGSTIRRVNHRLLLSSITSRIDPTETVLLNSK